MIQIPERFRPQINVAYPEGNRPIFEEWFYKDFVNDSAPYKHFNWSVDYLPIFWTSYWVNNQYGKDQKAKNDLISFVQSLDRAKKYFTICQYDDGPLVNLPENFKVFAMSGPRVDFTIPLVCQPHKYQFDVPRDIFCSFIGRVTHPLRRRMLSYLQGKAGYFTTSNIVPTEEYCKVMARSIFTLCPRGYGQSSFRICEALQQGSIPVYISDQFLLPTPDFERYGVVIHSKDVNRIDSILSGISPKEMTEKWEYGRKIYNEKFSFEGVKKLILDNI